VYVVNTYGERKASRVGGRVFSVCIYLERDARLWVEGCLVYAFTCKEMRACK
jgi:hypothetical protein